MKTAAGFLLGLFLVTPGMVLATTPDNSTQIAALQQLIVLLTQKLNALMAAQSNTPVGSNETFTTPSGTVVDQSGNTISVPASVFSQQSSELTKNVSPLYAQGASKLRIDLGDLNAAQCDGNTLIMCRKVAEDTVLQAKYVVLANTSDNEISSLAATVKMKISAFKNLQNGYQTTGTTRVARENASRVTPIITNLQKALEILTLRVW